MLGRGPNAEHELHRLECSSGVELRYPVPKQQEKRVDANDVTFRKDRPTYGKNPCNLHVSRERQFIKCQAALRLYSPSGTYAIKDERVQGGCLLEALCTTPFWIVKRKGRQKRKEGGIDTMVRTSHAIVASSQFQRETGEGKHEAITRLTFECQSVFCGVRQNRYEHRSWS